MIYLLDTCALSDFARGEVNTLDRVKATSPALIAVSSITAMEVEFGLKLNAARARRLAPVMHALLQATTILPYDIEDARAMQRCGRPCRRKDIQSEPTMR